MKLLVTGGTGGIGYWVIRKLVEEGVSPVVFDINPATDRLGDLIDKITLVQGDVLIPEEVLEVIKTHKISHIIHMAAFIGQSLLANPPRSVRVNCLGATNMLELARLNNIKRFVFTSSKNVFGTITGEYGPPTFKPVDENYPRIPTSVYGASKLLIEHYLELYKKIYGMDIRAVRFSATFGPGKVQAHANARVPVADRIIVNAAQGAKTSFPTGRDMTQDWLYYKDIAQAVVKAMMAENVKSTFFNIGTGVAKSLQDIANAAKKFFPNAVIELGPGADARKDGTSTTVVFDITRAREELGYNPQFFIEEALEDYYKELGYL
jgi:UDP-glucose 4-epimerase